MKAIKLQKSGLTTSQEFFKDHEFNWRRELLQIVELQGDGITVGQMAHALKVQKALNSISDEGTLFLEDADHEWLKGKVQNAKWRFVAPEVVDLHDAVCNAKTAEAPHLTGKDTPKDETPQPTVEKPEEAQTAAA